MLVDASAALSNGMQAVHSMQASDVVASNCVGRPAWVGSFVIRLAHS